MVVPSASPLESEHQQVLIHPELSVTGERIVSPRWRACNPPLFLRRWPGSNQFFRLAYFPGPLHVFAFLSSAASVDRRGQALFSKKRSATAKSATWTAENRSPLLSAK